MIQAKVRSTVSHVAPLVRATMANAAAQDDEAGHERQAADNLDGDVGLVLRPRHQLSAIAAVGEDALDEGEAGAGAPQHALRAIAVLDVGAMDLDRQESPVGVGQNMPFAPVDAFSGVVARESPFDRPSGPSGCR